MTRTVLLAAGRPGFRAALKPLLQAHGLVAVAESATAREAIATARWHGLDVCIVDADLPGGGLLAVRQITLRSPGLPVVVLMRSPTEADVLAAVHAGASAIVSTATSAAGLARAVDAVLGDGRGATHLVEVA